MSDRTILIGTIILGALSGLAQIYLKQREVEKFGASAQINIPGLPKLGNRIDIQCWPLTQGKWSGVYICKNW